MCEWAGPVLEPLRIAFGGGGERARIVIVPAGVLGVVPWSAARLADGRPACASFVLSSAASARQFLDSTSRVALPLDLDPLLVADPHGSLLFAVDEVLAIRDAHYPGAVVLGDLAAVEPGGVDQPPVPAGPGTSAEVLARLPGTRSLGASLVHLACHARLSDTVETSYVDLLDPLMIRAVLEHAAGRAPDAPGPLVVLSTCVSDLTQDAYDEALTLATAFLAAGAVGVVGTRWPVRDQATAVAMFAFHHFLAREGRPAAAALRAAQLWMLDGGRPPLPGMPEAMVGDVSECDLTDAAVWAAFTHHGQ